MKVMGAGTCDYKGEHHDFGELLGGGGGRELKREVIALGKGAERAGDRVALGRTRLGLHSGL